MELYGFMGRFDSSHFAVENEHYVYAVAAISSMGPIAIQYTDKRRSMDSAEFIDALETNILRRAREMFGDQSFTIAMVRSHRTVPDSMPLHRRTVCSDTSLMVRCWCVGVIPFRSGQCSSYVR